MGSFRELLQKLEDAHDQELSQLREELRHTRWASRKQTMTINPADLFDDSMKEALEKMDATSTEGASPGRDLQDLVMGSSNLRKKAMLEIYPEWEETGKEQPNLILARKSSLEQEESRNYLDLPTLGGCCYGNYVFRPEVPFIIAWQLLGVLVLGFDTLWVPMEVFPQEPTLFFSWLQGLTSLYWFIDIFTTMNTGIYNEKGDIDARRWQIFKSYARTWLTFDVLLISLDIYSYLSDLSSPESNGTAAGAARSGRQLLFALQSLIDSEWVTLMLAVVRNLAVILLSNHYIACVWFLIGSSAQDTEAECWVSREGIADEDMWMQYTVSVQWSLAQFTPGASLIQIKCRIERAFYIFVLVYGLVLGTCFVSSITTIMNAVWSLTRYNTSQNFLLKKFLKENSVSRNLSTRILRYVDYVLELRHKKTHHSKVHYLQLLSGPLHWELQREIHSKILNIHPVFASYSASASPALLQICATALSNIIYAKKDRVFHQSKEAKEMFFLVSGAFVYHVKATINHREIPITVKLDENTYFCEAALWLLWRTRGEMRALAESDALVVNSKKFREASMAYPAAATLGRAAAHSFYDHAMELTLTNEVGLTDVPAEVIAQFQDDDAQAGVDVLDIQRELQHAELEEAKAEMDWESASDASGPTVSDHHEAHEGHPLPARSEVPVGLTV